LRMRNAGQSEAASRSASVLKHEVDVCSHGGHVPRRYLGGPRGEYRLSEVPFCECVKRGSPKPHPALLVFSNTKWAYAVKVGMSLVGTSEGPGVNIAYRRSHFAKCAMRGSPPPHPARLGSPSTKYTQFSTASMPKAEIFEAPARARRFEGSIWRFRNERHPTAASHCARVSKHQIRVEVSGDVT